MSDFEACLGERTGVNERTTGCGDEERRSRSGYGFGEAGSKNDYIKVSVYVHVGLQVYVCSSLIFECLCTVRMS